MRNEFTWVSPQNPGFFQVAMCFILFFYLHWFSGKKAEADASLLVFSQNKKYKETPKSCSEKKGAGDPKFQGGVGLFPRSAFGHLSRGGGGDRPALSPGLGCFKGSGCDI